MPKRETYAWGLLSHPEGYTPAAGRDPSVNQLTPPEREVLELIVSGKSNKATALALDVSVRTVEDRRRSIMRKLKADSFAELVKLAVAENPRRDLPR